MPSCGQRVPRLSRPFRASRLFRASRPFRLGRLLRPLHFRFQRGQALGNRGRGMHWALKPISHGLRAEGREECHRRALKLPWAITTPLRTSWATTTPLRSSRRSTPTAASSSSTATIATFPSIAASQRLSDRQRPHCHIQSVLGDYRGPSNSDSNAGGLWVTEVGDTLWP